MTSYLGPLITSKVLRNIIIYCLAILNLTNIINTMILSSSYIISAGTDLPIILAKIFSVDGSVFSAGSSVKDPARAE